jgi:uncharacterized protein (TIGR00725 family)
MRRPVIGVVGTSAENSSAVDVALQLGKLIAQQGWIVLSGGRNTGVMKAVSKGAKEVPGSLTIGILPSQSSDVAPDIDVAIFTDVHNARNNIITLSSDIVIACGIEGPGTASEVALALKNGKPVIVIAPSEIAAKFFNEISHGTIVNVQTPHEAIERGKAFLLSSDV